jgi:deoxyribodipyrimidine photolyase-related protein
LVLVLGDQLDEDDSAFSDFDPQQDAVWMAEVDEESTHVVSAKQRTTVFLSAMRHFAAALREKGWQVIYSELDAADNLGGLAPELEKTLVKHQPDKLIITAPGEWRVLQSLRAMATKHQLVLEVRDDLHFFSTVRDFAAHTANRKQIRLEYFYRELRQKTGILMNGKSPWVTSGILMPTTEAALGRTVQVCFPPQLDLHLIRSLKMSSAWYKNDLLTILAPSTVLVGLSRVLRH